MMRLVMIVGTLALCFVLTGCGSDTHEGLIKDTIQAMDTAGSEVTAIKTKVADAVQKFEKNESTSLDFADAMKATEKLKKVGEEFQKIKRRIEMVRGTITDDQKKKYAEDTKLRLNDAFKSLLTSREQLRKSLEQAEALNNGQFKTKVADLRKKIIEAEGPFESLARQ